MKQPTIAIQGQRGSFHDAAARHFFGETITILPCELPFSTVFNSLQSDQADYAVCAIENSLYGSINEVYDLLLKHRFWVCGEVYLHIEQCLIGLPGSNINDIQEVHSHPVALSQCEAYLDTTLAHAQRFEHHDTAGSVADIATWNDPTKAAIASKTAAELYGMQVLQAGIETNHHNYTRFMVLSRKQTSVENANKSSIVIETSHKTGSLYQALGIFARHNINLSLLVSRPIIGKPQTYMFYIDFERGLQDIAATTALAELKTSGCKTTILGSYLAATLPK